MGQELLNQPLSGLPFAAIDFESAGSAPGETDSPVQVGIVRIENLFSDAPRMFDSYIACDRPVRWSAARVHGITSDMLTDAPAFTELWPQLRELLSGCVVVGHNPSTEMRFLRAFPGHGFGPWLDTLALSRQAIPTLADHSLSNVCRALRITTEVEKWVPGRRWHDALFDAAGSLATLRAIVLGLDMAQATLSQIPFAVTTT